MFSTDCDSDVDAYLTCSDASDSDPDSFRSISTLNDTLASTFSDVSKNFNVLHLNAQSIPAHIHDMQTSFDSKNIHAILVSETWLKPCLPSTLYSLPGFNLIRNDRSVRVGGGVAIYLRSNISFSVLSTSVQPPPTDGGEHLFIEVLLSHTKILLGVYYSPSLNVNYFSSFERILDQLVPSYSHSILMGDFNTCLLKNDYRTFALNSIINSSNMQILPLTATHRLPNCNPSLLDLIIVSSPQHVAKHGQFQADAFSYHDLIFLSYKIRPPKLKPKILLQRNFGRMDINKLREDASTIDWSMVLNSELIDDKVMALNSELIKLYDIHAPIKSVKIKHLPAPWITDEIKSLMHRKVIAKAKLRHSPTEENKGKYSAIRNRCNRVCRDALRRHIHNSVQGEDPAKVWKFLKSLGVGKSRLNTVPKDLDINSLNLHFSSSVNIVPTDKVDTVNYLSNIPTPDFPPFLFNQFTACDVKKSILSIQSNAMGSDNISRKMLIPIIDEVLPIICHILNFSISNGVFPSTWKDAQIIPLPKKSNPSLFSEFRPISILPFLSKVLERLVHNQLSSFLSRNNLMNPMQSGFRPGHSTASALVKVTDDIRLGMESGLLTILTLLDFSNAFNTVDFDILLATLSSINISPSVIDWFHSYLYGRRQRVQLEESFSSWCNTTAGVPQGGVLSPLLFVIFINSISNVLTSSYHLYADDLQIYTQASVGNLSDAVHRINLDLSKIEKWSKRFGLKVNPSKTQVIVIGSSRLMSRMDVSTLPQIVFDTEIIPYSKQVKNLGIIFDSYLSWGPQLESVCQKIFASGMALKRLRNFLPTATKVMLAQTLLLPILDYADVCYLDLTEDQLNKLERIQNYCIRFIFGLRKFDHVSQFRTKLKWLPIRLRRKTHILSFLYNILFNPFTPLYLKERFEFLHRSQTSPRTSVKYLLKLPTHETVFYDKSFTVEAARIWNLLPFIIRQAQSINSFKNLVANHYQTQNKS